VTSTQTVARELAASGSPEGLVVVADHQTAGRGRRGHVWTAPPGKALLVSCVLRPPLEPPRWPELTLTAGCAVAEAIEGASGLAARLKWPNDVLVQGRKVAGILAEGVVGPARFVVLGIGVNLSQTAADWPPALAGDAASLLELGRPVPRGALLTAVLSCLAARYEELLARGFAPILAAWRARALLGGWVSGPDGEGVAVDVAPTGALVVRRRDGTTATFLVDDVAPPRTLSGSRG
jgi:BirA family biotin operon repressor/biotin-[acetyl-CoA-carboxylase] ligase